MRRLILVAALVVALQPAAFARAPMETNQLVDDTGMPTGVLANPLYVSCVAGCAGGSGGGGTVAQGAAATDTAANRWPMLAYQGGTWSVGVTNFPSTWAITATQLPAALGPNTAANSLTVTLATDGMYRNTAGLPGDAAWDGSAASASQTAILKTLTTKLLSGTVKVDGSGVTQPVSGTITLGAGSATIGSIVNAAFGISGSLPAYAAIPTFKIDQTTPGTTNKVTLGADTVAVTNSALVADAAIPAGSPYTAASGAAANAVLATFDTTGYATLDMYVTAYGNAPVQVFEQASDGSANWTPLPLTYMTNAGNGQNRVFNNALVGGLWRASLGGKTVQIRLASTSSAATTVAIALKTAPWSAPSQYIEGGVINATPAASATLAGPTPVTSTGTSLVAKASAANLYGYSVTQGATAGFLALLNATAAPAASAAIAPLECVPVSANSYVARRQDIPDRYTTGLVVVSTSSCTTFTAVTPVLMSVVAQ